MRKLCLIIIALAGFIFWLDISCSSKNKSTLMEGETLARNHCASCHAFPDPSLLDKKTWNENVLPKMAELMNVDVYYTPYNVSGPQGDMPATRETPKLFPYKEWEKIAHYYFVVAPEKPLERRETFTPVETGLKHFAAHSFYNKISHPVTTLVRIDSITGKTFFGDGSIGQIFILNHKRAIIDSMENISTGIVDINIRKNAVEVLTMGILKPSDAKLGKLTLVEKGKPHVVLIDSLQRPVQASYGDLNGDEKEDILICEFGFRTGALSWFENKGNAEAVGTGNKFEKHVLRALPGATRNEIYDFNKDGRPDIIALMAQGDEAVFIYYNEGNGKFREERVLQFPPAYGSNYFQLFDFNNDGFQDILTTQGDNADFSIIQKSYHGIRIFLNNGMNRFAEKIFLPVHGAQKAIPADFDNDGDIDLVSIAFFPDYEKLPSESFIYWENTGNYQYKRYTFSGVTDGRWMTLDVGDTDSDGDKDVILGSALFSFGNVPQSMKDKWDRSPVSFIILENTLNKN